MVEIICMPSVELHETLFTEMNGHIEALFTELPELHELTKDLKCMRFFSEDPEDSFCYNPFKAEILIDLAGVVNHAKRLSLTVKVLTICAFIHEIGHHSDLYYNKKRLFSSYKSVHGIAPARIKTEIRANIFTLHKVEKLADTETRQACINQTMYLIKRDLVQLNFEKLASRKIRFFGLNILQNPQSGNTVQGSLKLQSGNTFTNFK